MNDCDTPISEAEVKSLLESKRGDWQAIADRADVSHSWLSKFVNGRIPNPGTQTLRKVRAAIEAGA